MVSGSIGGKLYLPNAQFSQCGFVCDSIQSQTPTVCISSSGQSSLGNRHKLPLYVSPVSGDRHIIDELEQSTCICISTNNSDTIYSHQTLTISVQNSSNCSSLASTFLVLRGAITISISSDLTPTLSKLTRAKGKFQHQNISTLALHAWELSNNQLKIKHFCKTLQILSLNQEERLLRKSMMQNGSYSPTGVIERRLIWFRPLLLS